MMSLRFAILGLSLAAPATSLAAAPLPLFAADQPIRITIQAPLKRLMSDRAFDGEVDGTVTDPSGLKLPAQFKLRGITRRKAEICDFAPIRVDFRNPPATSVFAGQDKLKLVTHCRASASFDQKILLEYAAYRMFNQLTDRSMRVRLANIDYVDADGRPLTTRIGFFLEDPRDTARRNNVGEVRGGTRIPTNWLSPSDAARYALFQHMIANHDWSMRAGPPGEPCCHNAELIGAGAPGSVFPVPYDFDFSGMVDSSYATPPEQIGITNVRQRRYRGYCVHSDHAAATAADFTAKRGAILGVLNQVPGLDPKVRERTAKYLDGFFTQIATPTGVSGLLKSCVA